MLEEAGGMVVAGGPRYGVAGGPGYGGCRNNEKYALRTFHCRSMQKALQAVPAALSYLFAS